MLPDSAKLSSFDKPKSPLAKNNDVKLLTFQKSNKSFYSTSKKINIRGLDLLRETNFFLIKIFNLLRRIYVIRKNLIKEKPDVLISFLETTVICIYRNFVNF